jgi:acyl-CoA synthetase (AMP-forming)/AMP-acid ligase II
MDAAGIPPALPLRPGDVIAIIGDFSPRPIKQLFEALDARAVVVPLSPETREEHPYFFAAAKVDWVIEGDRFERISATRVEHQLLATLRRRMHAGLVLFSTGTTGPPKAILHDFHSFFSRYRTRRAAFRTVSFLMFDHIGGLNTLFHTLFNRGCLIMPQSRSPQAVLHALAEHRGELLPTSPTFLRLLLLSGELDETLTKSLRVITYGTERMDQATLHNLTQRLPEVDFRQTYGMSELGILRVKSQSRESLWMKIGGEGVSTKVVDGVLWIQAANRMLGYLNAESPFDDEGWYNTGDLVETKDDYIRIVGRVNDVINVGGIKLLPGEVESVAMQHPKVVAAKAQGVVNPIIGQIVELTCQPAAGTSVTRNELKAFLAERLPPTKRPQSIVIAPVPFNHRFKQSA